MMSPYVFGWGAGLCGEKNIVMQNLGSVQKVAFSSWVLQKTIETFTTNLDIEVSLSF